MFKTSFASVTKFPSSEINFKSFKGLRFATMFFPISVIAYLRTWLSTLCNFSFLILVHRH
jgi:hypothetical protein